MRRLFVLIDWWKDCVAREKFKFPNTVSDVEQNIKRLMNKVSQSKTSDWYVPHSSHFVGEEYRKHSLSYEPQAEHYDEIYVFGMSLGACVLLNPFGYCYWPQEKRFIIKDCSIQESFGRKGVIKTINDYDEYLKEHEWDIDEAEQKHNEVVERDIKNYSIHGARFVHEQQFTEAPHRFQFELDSLYEPVKFRELDDIFSIFR